MPQEIKTAVAVIQNEIENLKITVGEIKTMLGAHIKTHQEEVIQIQKENEKKFAGKWVEAALSKVSWLVVSSVILAVLALVITNNVVK